MKIESHTAVPQMDMDRMDPQLVAAAKGMEANFLRQMMKTMRESVDESEEEKSDQGLQIFRGMLDEHYAEQAANKNSLGIAEMIVRYLTQQDSAPLPVKNSTPTEQNNLINNGAAKALEVKK